MARVASDFFESPGLRAAIELQRKLDKMCNPSWMRQVEQMERIERQLSGSLSAYQTLHPAILSSASAVAQTWPTDRLADVLRRASEAASAIQPLLPALEQYSELQSALSDRLSEWCVINEATLGTSLAQQREQALVHICSLAENLAKATGVDDVEPIDISSELSSEDQQILADEMTELLAEVNADADEAPETHPQKMNWFQRLTDRLSTFAETHPRLAQFLINFILYGVIASIIGSAIWEVISSAKVYEHPNSASPVIFQLEPLQQVKVIGEQPYYFQIELTDGNTQETIVGFVSKRSLKAVDMGENTSTLDEP